MQSKHNLQKGAKTLMDLYILYIGLNMLQVDVLLYQTAVESSKVSRRLAAEAARPLKKGRKAAPFGGGVAVEAARGCEGSDHAAASPSLFRRRLRCEQPLYVMWNKTENRAFPLPIINFRIDGLFSLIWKLGTCVRH